MSGFPNRRGANVYALNMGPSAEYDMSLQQQQQQQQQQQSPIAFDDTDLSLFTNADLVNFDWDEGMPANQFKQDPQSNFHFPADQFQSPTGEFQFGMSPTAATFQNTPHFQGISPNPTSFQKENDQSPASSTHRASQASIVAQKRVRDGSAESSENTSPDDVARRAADEDKRRRNTAASARFRVKKKQREQQMEQTARDMSDKVKVLEQKVLKLEDENTFLRGLITEKEGKSVDIDELRKSKQQKEEAAALIKAESA